MSERAPADRRPFFVLCAGATLEAELDRPLETPKLASRLQRAAVQAQNETITDLLAALQAGRPGALGALIPIVYDHLRMIAAAHLKGDRGTPTLQPTALVHELYFTLVDQRSATWQNRAHFFATASILMRRLIVDHARRNSAAKRGGDQLVPLDEGMDAVLERPAEMIRLDEALDALKNLEPRQARIVELRFFGGMSIEETAEVLDISPATVKREWAIARAWLHTELAE